MEGVVNIFSFYRGRKVFITGHNGFKGSWLTTILLHLGAEVKGCSLASPEPSLFHLLQLEQHCESTTCDIRDLKTLKKELTSFNPEVIIHMAAQPLVIESYKNPVYTYETNVMGTVNLLESARCCSNLQSIINVTTDKVYENKEWAYGYREIDRLNGYDPYSNSKSCSELVTDSFKKSFLKKLGVAVSTMRAGNVIGGGDFSENRIVPDCYRALVQENVLAIRNPNSVRPYQHVLEAVTAYLYVAACQAENHAVCGSYNIGPTDSDCVKTLDIVKLYQQFNKRLEYFIEDNIAHYHEANLLRLDCSKIHSVFNWRPLWNIELAMKNTVELYSEIASTSHVMETLLQQINEYIALFEKEIR